VKRWPSVAENIHQTFTSIRAALIGWKEILSYFFKSKVLNICWTANSSARLMSIPDGPLLVIFQSYLQCRSFNLPSHRTSGCTCCPLSHSFYPKAAHHAVQHWHNLCRWPQQGAVMSDHLTQLCKLNSQADSQIRTSLIRVTTISWSWISDGPLTDFFGLAFGHKAKM